MNGKKRGIRLKPLDEEQEGYKVLLDFFAVDSVRPTRTHPPEAQWVEAVDRELLGRDARADRPAVEGPSPPPVTPRQRVARLVREELEKALNLLDNALMAIKTD